ncbi:MAG: hypothetical protein LUC43_07090, partial [Burkholderiales bacterium]|nr:hypothetical protein [Burkholderiales bacterium]
KQEVQGNEWEASSAEGWIASSDLTTDIDKLWEEAKAREQEACSGCHAAPEPDHFNANQWASQLPLKGGRAGHTRAGKNELMFRWLQQFAEPL